MRSGVLLGRSGSSRQESLVKDVVRLRRLRTSSRLGKRQFTMFFSNKPSLGGGSAGAKELGS